MNPLTVQVALLCTFSRPIYLSVAMAIMHVRSTSDVSDVGYVLSLSMIQLENLPFPCTLICLSDKNCPIHTTVLIVRNSKTNKEESVLLPLT